MLPADKAPDTDTQEPEGGRARIEKGGLTKERPIVFVWMHACRENDHDDH